MDHWPGHERHEKTWTTDEPKEEGKQGGHLIDPSLWQWPHLQHGSIGGTTLISKNGRVQWTSVVDTSHGTRWLALSKPVKVFPETRPPQVNMLEHSTRQRIEKGLQYLRTYFPDADFPRELVGGTLEEETTETRRLQAFNPLLGDLLEILPCHHTENESTVVFPMGELGRELNISRLCLGGSGNMVFKPSGLTSFAFETPILQISSAVKPPEWIATPSSTLLIRTYTSSSLLRLQRSKVIRDLDITRSETGDIPIVDAKILASGPDIVVVNRSGEVYKCNTYRGKTMQLARAHGGDNHDHFWQLGITRRDDEYFLASCNFIKHIDLRSGGSVSDVFCLDHTSTIVTSFESPLEGYISRITTTSDVIWLDDRFRRRPLLSFKHNRSFDRTLRVLSANLSGASISLLTSRRNGFVTLYDVGRGPDRLLHCNSVPSCMPHNEPMFTAYDGDAVVALPTDAKMTLFRLCRRGSIHRQDIGLAQPDEDHPGSVQDHVTHEWGEDVQALEKQIDQLQIDFGPAGERHYTEINLRGAYEEMFAIADDIPMAMNENDFRDMLTRLPDIWQDGEEIPDDMLTMFDVISRFRGENRHGSSANFLASGNTNSKQVFDALMQGQLCTQRLGDRAQWHYSIQNTSIPGRKYGSADCNALNESLKELNLISEVDRHDPSAHREVAAREQLVLDLVLSNDVYSARQISKHDATTVARPSETSYSEDPPEVKFGYFRPIDKSGADRYADKNPRHEQDLDTSSPLGVRLLLAEWQSGTNPKDYTYRDPYGLVDIYEQPIPQYRRPPAPQAIPQRRQIPQRPPAVVAVATQPPVVQAVERAPTAAGSQNAQRFHSQQQGPDLDAFSQEPMMSTQVLPGPFGGRPAAGKKPAKKRIGGF